MPLREQSRIKADTVAEECTCEECQAPAPEPSAPPAGVPVCPKCGKPMLSHTFYNDGPATVACPPPSDPVTVATDCVPAGYRLGAGWVVDRTYLCSCTGCRPNTSTEYYKPRSCGKGACAAHAVLMGALVPIDTARSVPPGPALDSIDALWYAVHGAPIGPEPVKAGPSETLADLLRWQPTAAEVQAAYKVAAPASEPAVRPDAEADEYVAIARRKYPDVSRRQRIALTLADRLDAARAEVEQLRGKLTGVGGELQLEVLNVSLERDQATARVRSMREAAAKAMTCSHCGKRPATCVGAYEDATVDSPACDECCAHGNEDGRCEPIDGPARIRALPLDTGTATDTSGVTDDDVRMAIVTVVRNQSQEAAIKAAVAAANNRAADAFRAWIEDFPGSLCDMQPTEFEAWLRSGEDAPGAVTPAKGEG